MPAVNYRRCLKHLSEASAMVRYYRWNSMLSGAGTMVGNFLGTFLNVATKPGRTLAAAVVDLPVSAVTGQRTRYFSEVASEIYGMAKSMPAMWKTVARNSRAIRELDQVASSPIPGLPGKVIGVPIRVLSATDNFFYDTTFHGEMWRIASRVGKKTGKTAAEVLNEQGPIIAQLEKLETAANPLRGKMHAKTLTAAEGKQLANFERDIAKLRRQTFVDEAALQAERTIFTAQEGEALDKSIDYLNKMATHNPLVDIVLPFRRTPANVVREAYRGSPLGFLTAPWRAAKSLSDLQGGADITKEMIQGRFSNDVGQALAGTSMMYFMIQMAANGYLKANPYKERAAAERVTEEAAGILPNTVQIGDWSVPVSRLEPFGSFLLNAARVAELRQGDNPPENLVEDLVRAMENLVLLSAKETFLDPFAEFAEALQDDTALNRYMQNVGGSLVPRAISQFDQRIKETPEGEEGVISGFKNKVPGTGEAKLGLFGQERDTQNYVGSILLGRTGKVGNDPLAAEMLRVGSMHLSPSGMDGKFKAQLAKRGIGYSEAEDRTLQLAKGRAQRMLVERVVNSPTYQGLPQDGNGNRLRKEMLDRAFKQASDSINQRAKALKLAKVPLTQQALFRQ